MNDGSYRETDLPAANTFSVFRSQGRPRSPEALVAQVWPDWTLEAELGRGSFGTVYRAVKRDSMLTSTAAIKVISIPRDRSELDSLRSEGLSEEGTRSYLRGLVTDFVSEIQLMESLKGMQNIVSVEDYKVLERSPEIGWDILIRMELLYPFQDCFRDRAPTEAEVVQLGIDMCSALEICERKSIIHRDIKPENIFVNEFGYYKLGDFGVARRLENLTAGLSRKGTLNYMAPEVVYADSYDARVDIYSLGLVLYRLLNENRLPFLTEEQLLNPMDRERALQQRLRGDPLPPPCAASPAMQALVLKACAWRPEDRYQTAAEMKMALVSVENGSFRPEASKTRLFDMAPGKLAALVGVGLLAVGALIFSLIQLLPSPRSARSSAVYETPAAAVSAYETPQLPEAESAAETPSAAVSMQTLPAATPSAVTTPTPAPAPAPTRAPSGSLRMIPYTGSASQLKQLGFSGASASSELNDPTYGSFPASLAIDGRTDTAWQEGVEGYGHGESLTVYFASAVQLSVIELYPGFAQSEYTYYVNSRPSSLRFDFSDGSSCTAELSDAPGAVWLALSESVETSYIRMTILDTYDAAWQDTCISEIRAYGSSFGGGPVYGSSEPVSPYGIAYRNHVVNGVQYSVKEVLNVITETYYKRKGDDGKYREGYSSHRNNKNSYGYDFGFYYADGLMYYAEVRADGYTILVKLYYWGDQLIAARDYRGDDDSLKLVEDGSISALASEFSYVYRLGMDQLD